MSHTLVDPGPAAIEFGNSARSETGVCRQNAARMLQAGATQLAVVSTPQAEIALFDPVSGDPGFPAAPLMSLAKNRNKVACFYKASARYAAHFRRSGLKTLHIADEMVLNPSLFTLQGADFRQLRRKLNKATKAGVCVTRADDPPMPQMARLDHDWQLCNGPARGFSMGRFCPGYLRKQRVYIARQGNDLVGFISLHVGPGELCLDLMRTTSSAPDGTMHLLIMAAISEAANEGRTRLSLAALQPALSGKSWIKQRAVCLIGTLSGGPGLTQFKTCFKPRREPLYAAARSWPAMALALLDLAIAIRRPDTNLPQNDDEKYAFARARDT